jgi:hypothetical protein
MSAFEFKHSHLVNPFATQPANGRHVHHQSHHVQHTRGPAPAAPPVLGHEAAHGAARDLGYASGYVDTPTVAPTGPKLTPPNKAASDAMMQDFAATDAIDKITDFFTLGGPGATAPAAPAAAAKPPQKGTYAPDSREFQKMLSDME